MITENRALYILLLEAQYEKKRAKNACFSMRAFSRYLGLADTILSDIFRGNRHLPKNKAKEIAQKLELSASDTQKFLVSVESEHISINSLIKEKVNEKDRLILDLNDLNYQIIAKNIYYTFLSLLELETFQNNYSWMQKRLGISEDEIKKVIEDLIAVDLIYRENGKLVKTHKDLDTPSDITSHALRASHKETLDDAKKALEEVAIEYRYLASQTMCMNREKMDQAKKIIREFRVKFAELMETNSEIGGLKDDVYTLAIQFYPQTKPSTPE